MSCGLAVRLQCAGRARFWPAHSPAGKRRGQGLGPAAGLAPAYGQLAALAEQGQGRVLCDGTNADDLLAYRPGLRALEEGCVRSPLAEAGLSKADIRKAASATGLDRPDQRARPCLLTRMAYGMRPDAAILARLATAEAELAEIGPLGDFRLRLTPEPVLQAENLPDLRRHEVQNILQRYGFWPCKMEIGASVSGFYDAGGAGHKL